MKYAAPFNSRQPLQPSGRLGWIKSSRAAVRWAVENRFGLVSSVGVPTWELLTALGSIHKLPMKLIIPIREKEQLADQVGFYLDQFELEADLIRFVPCEVSGSGKSLGRQKTDRDSVALSHADQVLPVSIRPRGMLEELISQHRKRGGSVLDQFRAEYQPRTNPLAYSLEGVELNQELRHLNRDFVVHWTRGTNLPWPDERLIDYYRDIIQSMRFPRQAVDSLNHILKGGVIRASGRNIPEGSPVVSFSSLKPYELVKLVKWRARRKEMSFEPYGLGIDSELAERVGIKPVVYFDKEDRSTAKNLPSWQAQSQGVISDWRHEKELRYLSDFEISELPKDKLILFSLLPEEAKQLTATYGIKSVSFLP